MCLRSGMFAKLALFMKNGAEKSANRTTQLFQSQNWESFRNWNMSQNPMMSTIGSWFAGGILQSTAVLIVEVLAALRNKMVLSLL